QLFLAVGAEARVDRRYFGEDHQSLGVEAAGEEGGGAVLVDHGVDPCEVLAAPRRRDAAAAAGDHDRPGREQRADRVQLDDLERGGGGDDAPPAASRVVDDLPAALGLELTGLRLVVERADRLRRPLEGGIVLRDEHVREQADDGPARDRGELAFDQRADLRLRLRDREVERQRRRLRGRALLPQELVADLGAVSVRDDELLLAEQWPQ